MMRRTAVAVALVGIVGCGKHEEPRPKASPYAGHPSTLAGATPTSEVRLGGGASDEPPHLGFRIVKVYEKQKATTDGLGHADGGSWEFFDAATSDGAPFTFGFFAAPAKGELPMSFGEGVLATSDRARFVASLAKGFGQPVPATARAARPGKPMALRLVVLGRNQARLPGGGYGDGGTATATKLFFSSGATEAEVFFNFDVAKKSGEFSEKDADYDKDLIAMTAAAL
jgi:hypothetical protein